MNSQCFARSFKTFQKLSRHLKFVHHIYFVPQILKIWRVSNFNFLIGKEQKKPEITLLSFHRSHLGTQLSLSFSQETWMAFSQWVYVQDTIEWQFWDDMGSLHLRKNPKKSRFFACSPTMMIFYIILSICTEQTVMNCCRSESAKQLKSGKGRGGSSMSVKIVFQPNLANLGRANIYVGQNLSFLLI